LLFVDFRHWEHILGIIGYHTTAATGKAEEDNSQVI
jgi:hypothetical protein